MRPEGETRGGGPAAAPWRRRLDSLVCVGDQINLGEQLAPEDNPDSVRQKKEGRGNQIPDGTHMFTVSHQKSRIFLPPMPGSRALGTPARWLYRPVVSSWGRATRGTRAQHKCQIQTKLRGNKPRNQPGPFPVCKNTANGVLVH